MKRIPIAGPSITKREIEYVSRAAADGWYEDAGLFPRQFESAFADYLGRGHAISLPSCTSGIHLSLAALGVGAGDEVVLPDVTWIASAAPVTYLGAKPVFADIDPHTWCLSPESVGRAITDRTKAVIAVDLYGGMPAMDQLVAMLGERGIALIEDAAEAIGSEYDGSKAGTFGETSVFSFHGSKTMTTGEGGMVVTDDPGLHERMLVLRDHGRQPGDTNFLNTEVGFKYKMGALQAALGLAQLERIEELIEKKRAIFGWYRSRLGNDDRFELNHEPAHTKNSYWMVTVLLKRSPEQRDRVRSKLDERGIDTRPFFHPLSSIPAYASGSIPHRVESMEGVGAVIAKSGINLPSALSLTEVEVDYVCEQLKSA